jgi:hypothetical protein
MNDIFEENIAHYQGICAGEKYFYALYNKKPANSIISFRQVSQ